MTSVSDYNLLKEGHIYNNTSVATYNVTASGLSYLYNGVLDAEAFSVPSGLVSSLVVEFGEYYSISNFKLYLESVVLSDISAMYGLEYIDGSNVLLTSSGTYVYGTIEDNVGFLGITISGSVDTVVYELEVEGTLNEFIGFGTSSSGVSEEIVNLGGVPSAYYSPNPVKVDVYNEYSHEIDILVSVAPTTSGSDEYVYLSTEKDGVYYGINDNGVKQPSFVEIVDVNESLGTGSVSDLLSRWDFGKSSASYLYGGDGFLRLFSSNNYIPNHRSTAPYNGYTDSMLVSKFGFTANQSFTISLEVRVVDATLDSMESADASITTNKFFLGFTDTYPISEHSYNTPTVDRVGKSLAAVWIGAQKSLGEYDDLSVGTAANDFDFDVYTGTTNFHRDRNTSNSHPIVSKILLEYLSEYVFNESEYLDGDSNAPWRTLKLSYDHTTRTVYYYFDNLSLGQVLFSSDAFFESCKFFFGYSGVGQFAIDMRNFVVEKNVVHKVDYNQTSAGAYSYLGELNSPNGIIDGVYEEVNSNSSWVSDKNPVAGDYFSVSFGDSRTIDAVRVKQPPVSQYISISGSITNPARYSLDSTILYFDTGDIRYIDFSSVEPVGLDGWDVSYLTTTSGTVESVFGATSVSGIFVTLNDRGQNPVKEDVLVIDEIQFYTIIGTGVSTQASYVEDSYPWTNGSVENIKHFGSTSSYELDSVLKFEVAGSLDCSKLVRYSDYDASSPILANVYYPDNSYVHHYFETAFMIYGRDTNHSEGNILNGHTGWFWRFFDYAVDIAGVYVRFHSDILSLDSCVDKWKVQYLKEGGNPNSVEDWIDIPPISNIYVDVGDYATYVDYLIANNDGEYYTDFMDSLDFTSQYVILPDDLLCQKNYYANPVFIRKSSKLSVDTIYVEFDQTYKTQGVRFIIADGYEDKSRSTKASGYTIDSFMCYSDKSSGYYLSPIFDTGTKQNTERIFIGVSNYGGDSYAMYRSHSTPPSYKRDTLYERWETVCSPFGGMENLPAWTPFFGGVDIVDIDGIFYFLGQNTDRMITYNSVTGKWSWAAYFSLETTGEVIRPDLLTANNTVLIDGKIICACTSDGAGGARSSGLMQYHLTENEYSYTGWETFPYQRQVEAVNASMASDGSERVFFFGVDGTVTVFYVSSGQITTEDRVSMPMYGYPRREDFVPVYVSGKIYVIGGSGGGPGVGPGYALDIYDVNNDTWSTGSSPPYKVNRATALHYDGYIYVLPNAASYGEKFAVFMKYCIVEDSWTVLPHLSYNYRSSYVATGAGFVGNTPTFYRYLISGGYIYGFNYLNSLLDFRRFKVSKESWEPGEASLADDISWINNGGQGWKSVTTVSGETMPQDRYIQYKVVLTSDEGSVTPTINGATLVQPLVLSGIAASGTENFYVKSGVSVNDGYEAWYSGFTDYNSSIIYSRSNNGYEFNKGISSLYDVTVSGGSGYTYMYYDSCAIKNGNEYEMWATHARIKDSNSFDVTWGNIHKVTVSGGYETYTKQHVLARGVEGTYDTESIYSPYVLKVGPNYKMWYTGVDSLNVNRILYAESLDGLVWSNIQLSQDIGTFSLEPDADYSSSSNPSVIYTEGGYKMWYEGVDNSEESRIIYCYSIDGVNWVGHTIIIDKISIDGSGFIGCGSPNVIYDIDTYKIWFIVYGERDRFIYHATSPDGVSWSNFKSTLVRKHEGTYDYSLITSINVVIDRNMVEVPTIHNAKLKIYND